MKEGGGGGKERETPTHLIKNSKLTHAGRVTKNKKRMRLRLRSVNPRPRTHIMLRSRRAGRKLVDYANDGRETRGSRSLDRIRNKRI